MSVSILESLESRTHFSVTTTVLATGLAGPRGLTVGPDGNLYVAEAGTGGTRKATGPQVGAGGGGPTTGGNTSTIAEIKISNGSNKLSTFAYGFPSSISQFHEVEGVSDVIFAKGSMYALLSGGGPSNGTPTIDNDIFRIDSKGGWHYVADLSKFERNHPVKNPQPAAGYQPDGDFISFVFLNDKFYVTAANHQEILQVSLGGEIARVADISTAHNPAQHQWAGPTGIATDGKNLYFDTLGSYPLVPGSQDLYKLTTSGSLSVAATGLTGALDLKYFDGNFYALETSTAAGLPTPNTGAIVKITPTGKQTTIVSGLNEPTGLAFDSKGNIYVSENGYGPAGGEVVRISGT